MSLALIFGVGVKAYITEKQLLTSWPQGSNERKKVKVTNIPVTGIPYMTEDFQPGPSLLKFHHLLNAVG